MEDQPLTTGAFNRLYRSDPEFATLARRVYSYLDTMPPGKVLRLHRYSGTKLYWIRLTAAAYICEGLHAADYEFSDDYMNIVRHCVPPDVYRWVAASKGLSLRYLFPDGPPQRQQRSQGRSARLAIPEDFQKNHRYRTINER